MLVEAGRDTNDENGTPDDVIAVLLVSDLDECGMMVLMFQVEKEKKEASQSSRN